MAAPLEIVNRALSKLGEAHISSMDEAVKAAALAASMYGGLRDAEIAAHAWHFARARARLHAAPEKPAFGWDFKYPLPEDCLRVIGISDPEGCPFVMEGCFILANHGPSLDLIYLSRTEEEKFPPLFAEALAARLAAEMCESITGSSVKKGEVSQEYRLLAREARRVNALGLPPQRLSDDSWILARNGLKL